MGKTKVIGMTKNFADRLETGTKCSPSPIPIKKNDPQRAQCVVVGILHNALFFRVLECSEAFFVFGTTFARDMSFIQRR